MVKFSKMDNLNCFPVCLAGSIDIVKEKMKLCTNWEEDFSSFDKIMVHKYGKGEFFSACKSSCTQYQYEGQRTFTKEQEVIDNGVMFGYVFLSDEIQIFEEYLMFGVNDLIGTVGGHCGLFIGFSFYGCISTFLQYFQKS